MNARVLRVELRRSVAPWAGAAVLAIALTFLFLVPGIGTVWTAQWTAMALETRFLLVLLWPLVLGLGALQGLRDRRSKMSELLTSTPRPARHRAATLVGAMAITLASAFTLVLLTGAVQVLTEADYFPFGWLPISLVGLLGLVAGAVLGMGIGRALPSPLTPPALAVAAFVFVNLVHPSTDWGVPTAAVPNRLSLLSPAVAEVREVLLTLSAPVHVGQTLWLLGVTATGFALLVAATPRARLLALAPVLAGVAVALLVLPADPRRTYVVDETAAAQVCDGPVCVARVHQDRLADLAGPGREALALLHDTLGDRAPVSLRETTALLAIGDTPERSRTAVLVDFDDGMLDSAKGEKLTRALLAQGLAPTCFARSRNESGTLGEIAAQGIAAGWVLGDYEPLGGTLHSSLDQSALADPVWKELTARPRAEQVRRIRATHTAAVSCAADPLSVLEDASR
ncbi:hypothetical protein ACWD4G_16585 [Streptomyces sp. NPDC002643]